MIYIVFYSRYGNTLMMAEAINEGVEAAGGEACLRRVRETAPEAVIEKDRRWKATIDKMKSIPEADVEELSDADALIIGSPTRFGNMAAPMKEFIDLTGRLWVRGALSGKVGAVFGTNSTMHGGKESTLLFMMLPLLHHGMVIVGIPPTEVDVATHGSYYGATATTGPISENHPTKEDLKLAKALGKRVCEISKKINMR
ncbi:MAG: NAD(P)H:quinone oxidoreductase [Halobacteriota archaeon]|nr:NAD(P)H:quinone oxidoreductase [Halobacteriota archaeon]